MKALLLMLAMTSALALPDSARESNQDDQTKAYMRAKLGHSQRIMEGLATEKYEMIAKSAQDLNLLSNESNWNVYQTEEYLRLSREFRSSTLRLRDAATEKNLDGATLAYFEVTLSCVRCHKYTRDQKDK